MVQRFPLSSRVLAVFVTLALPGGLRGSARLPGGSLQESGSRRSCNNMWPSWSPDGRRVVFASDRTGDAEIYVLTIGEGEPVRLTRSPGRDAHPAFAPDGRRIAFQSPREGVHTNLYVMDADGSGPVRLTAHTGFAGMPVWSPDGEHLLYQWTPEFPREKWRIMRVALNGGTPRQLTDGSANDQVANWSPDGRQIAFHSDRHGPNQLYTMNADGTGARRLTTGGSEDRSPSYSPDGRLISFMSERDGQPAGLYVLTLSDRTVRRVGAYALGHGVPFFSPDGTRVLATAPQTAGTEVWSIRLPGTSHEVLAACTPPR